MEKQPLVDQLLAELNARLARMLEAAGDTRQAATDGENKSENKYDTRGLEASYLAAGQAAQVEELTEAVRLLETTDFPEWDLDTPIASGALVEAEPEDSAAANGDGGGGGDLLYYLLAPRGGGITLQAATGESVTVLAPGSALRQKLEGHRAGDLIRDPDLLILDVY